MKEIKAMNKKKITKNLKNYILLVGATSELAGSLIKKLSWENGFFRKDIGYKVID